MWGVYLKKKKINLIILKTNKQTPLWNCLHLNNTKKTKILFLKKCFEIMNQYLYVVWSILIKKRKEKKTCSVGEIVWADISSLFHLFLSPVSELNGPFTASYIRIILILIYVNVKLKLHEINVICSVVQSLNKVGGLCVLILLHLGCEHSKTFDLTLCRFTFSHFLHFPWFPYLYAISATDGQTNN